jgi:primosomal protein N' (replication factor Y)
LLFTHANENRCREESEKLAARMKEVMSGAGIASIEIIGPAPAFIHRLRGRYRWNIILRGAGLPEFLAHIDPSPAWTIDIDPAGL